MLTYFSACFLGFNKIKLKQPVFQLNANIGYFTSLSRIKLCVNFFYDTNLIT